MRRVRLTSIYNLKKPTQKLLRTQFNKIRNYSGPLLNVDLLRRRQKVAKTTDISESYEGLTR